jgi:membrane protein required for colicin V production
MEIYDIVMLVVLVGAALFGAIKGFAWQLASIASIAVSYFVAYRFREPFSQSIQAEPPWNRFLAMLILYIGTALVIWVLFRMVSGTIDRMRLKEFDRQIGALFGLAKGALYCTLITMFAVTLMGDGIREKIVMSKSGHYIAKVLDRSQAVIPPEIHEVVEPYLQRFDERFNGSEDGDLLNSMPWMATQDSGPDPGQIWGQNRGFSQPFQQPQFQPVPQQQFQGVPQQQFQGAPRGQWAPQQAQQPPVWNGIQR